MLRWQIVWAAGLSQLLAAAEGIAAPSGSSAAPCVVRQRDVRSGDVSTEESVAAERYIANLNP